MAKSELKLILASASPRRRELIGHLKLPFEVIALSVPEHSDATDPVQHARDIAEVKGKAVFEQLLKERRAENFFIVSADTIVVNEGKIYNKPADRNEARKFLSDLSGRTHSVFTAVSLSLLVDGKVHRHSFVDESKVTFDHISDVLMERYLDTGDSLDKAGAYGIQGPSLTFISRVDGSYSNVVGFPLSRFVNESQKFLNQHFPGVSSWPKFILIFLLMSSAHADIFGFGADKSFQTRIPGLTEKLKKLQLNTNPGFEDSFNQTVRDLENGIEEEKLYCSGEAPDTEGKVLPADQKQLCFRELKKNYLEAVEVIFEAKKKYMQLLHNEQQNRLTEIHRKLKADIDKNF